ncbi:MAG: hypothetical protein Q7U76_08440 [Nitrospirota bacterium]|nr:hypothetical protein [Nitrospirota bacterium]
MSLELDPLAKAQSQGESQDRLWYATGVLLDAEDFLDEQTYHRGRLARALAYLYGSGTVAGLRVAWEPALLPGDDPLVPEGRPERIRVEPGLAIDRLGRLIELPRTACLRLNRWYEAQASDDLAQGFHGGSFNGVVVDVFLAFVACERGKTPAFASGPYEALDPVVPSRIRDGYVVTLVIRKETDPPLPANQWPDVSGIADPVLRAGTIRQTVFDAWREGTQWQELDGQLAPMVEHAAGHDTTALLLARLVLPATQASAAARPERTDGAAVSVDNNIRPIVFNPGRWAGEERHV